MEIEIMSKVPFFLVAATAAVLASTSAFANRAGGPDAAQAIQKSGVAADWDHTVYVVQVSGGPAPTVPVDKLTGGQPSDPAHMINYGRFTGISG